MSVSKDAAEGHRAAALHLRPLHCCLHCSHRTLQPLLAKYWPWGAIVRALVLPPPVCARGPAVLRRVWMPKGSLPRCSKASTAGSNTTRPPAADTTFALPAVCGLHAISERAAPRPEWVPRRRRAMRLCNGASCAAAAALRPRWHGLGAAHSRSVTPHTRVPGARSARELARSLMRSHYALRPSAGAPPWRVRSAGLVTAPRPPECDLIPLSIVDTEVRA